MSATFRQNERTSAAAVPLSAAPDLTEPQAGAIMLIEGYQDLRPASDLLQSLGEAERARLRSVGVSRVFEAGEALWQQGDVHQGIYLIRSGRIRSFYIAPSAREVTLAYWFAGNFVGGPDIFGGEPYQWSSSAVQRSEALFLPGAALREAASQSAPIALALLDAMAFKARCYSAMAQMLGTRSASERLHQLLTFLANVYGLKGPDGILVAASFNHSELASLIGSTRQWVTVRLADLQRRGVLKYNRGMILIRSLPALTAAGC